MHSRTNRGISCRCQTKPFTLESTVKATTRLVSAEDFGSGARPGPKLGPHQLLVTASRHREKYETMAEAPDTFPVLTIDRNGIMFSARSQEQLGRCSKRGLRKGCFNDLLIIETSGQSWEVKSATKIPGSWQREKGYLFLWYIR